MQISLHIAGMRQPRHSTAEEEEGGTVQSRVGETRIIDCTCALHFLTHLMLYSSPQINTVNNQSQLLYHQEQHLQQVPYYYHQASVNQQSSEANHFKSPAALPPLLFNRSAGGAAAAAVSKRPPPSTQYPHHQYQAPYYHPVVVGPSPVLVAGCPPGRSLAATTMDGGHNPLRLNSIIYEDNNHVSCSSIPSPGSLLIPPWLLFQLANVHRADLYQKCNRGSHSSDTSSAYSGSDTMTSIHSSTMDPDEMIDLSGLVESVVDSDEEDLAESMDVSSLI